MSIELQPPTWRALAGVYRPLGQHVQAATAHLSQRDRDRVIAALTAMHQAFVKAGQHLT